MKRAIVATLAVLLAGAAIQPVRAQPAQSDAKALQDEKPLQGEKPVQGDKLPQGEKAAQGEMALPRLTPLNADWQAAATDLGAPAGVAPAAAFAPLNAAASARFPGIANSAAPVLLPFDVAGYRQARAANPEQPPNADAFVLAGFRASSFFLAGPAGYDAGFALRAADVPEFHDIRYRKPVHLLMSGFAMLYQLGGPALPEGEPVEELQDKFPGIRRILFESYVRYVFQRYGVTYAVATYCQDRPPRARYLTCRQGDRIITRFLEALHLVGGGPAPQRTSITPPPIARPARVAPAFTYYSPGFIIPGSGRRPGLSGRADYTVYGNFQFPLKAAPAFANSQSFNNWGNCDTTGRSPRRLGRKGMHYTCTVNGRALVFDESAGRNYSYPWRDNFCEHRRYFAGQCPGGQGHQGQDLRPTHCRMFNRGADRCLPYQDKVVAPADSMVWRPAKQEALLMFVNTTNSHLRIRYMHMSPVRLDAAGLLSGRRIKRGEVIGTVGNYNRFAGGTTYHLHVDLQVPTEAGWVLVNPYMTLVSAYERLIGARGREIRPGDPAPPLDPVPPVIGHPHVGSAGAAAASPAQDHMALPTPRPSQADTRVVLPKRKPHIRTNTRKRRPTHSKRRSSKR